jgi:hypothetical protein
MVRVWPNPFGKVTSCKQAIPYDAIIHHHPMLKSLANILGALVLLTALLGCKDLASFSFKLYPDVDLKVSVRKVSHHDVEASGKMSFVHFKYDVTVHSDRPAYFKVENMVLNNNGTVNTSASYDTVASIVPHWQLLKKGDNVIEVYASFPGTVDAATLPNITFTHFGFSRNPEMENK